MSFCDGEHLAHMLPVQDHKRAYEGDTGPNTGGMGSYSCADHLLPFVSAEAVARAQAINKACVIALKDRLGEGFKGILYGGYMLTPDRGVMLIEFNCRFGDPECLNLLSLLEPSTDFAAVCAAMANGGLKQVPVSFAKLGTRRTAARTPETSRSAPPHPLLTRVRVAWPASAQPPAASMRCPRATPTSRSRTRRSTCRG